MHVFLSLRVSRGFRFFCSPTRDALRVGQADRYPVVSPSPYLQRDARLKIEFKAKLAPLVRLSHAHQPRKALKHYRNAAQLRLGLGGVQELTDQRDALRISLPFEGKISH